MKGTIYSLKPSGELVADKIARRLPEREMLAKLKAAIGGGWLEKVPGFTTVSIDGEQRACVALCDEDGKRKRLPLNRKATRLWHFALMREGHPGLNDGQGNAVDVLCGDVAIIIGDRAFMNAL